MFQSNNSGFILKFPYGLRASGRLFTALTRPSCLVTGTLYSQSERTSWKHGGRLQVEMCCAASLLKFALHFSE